MTPAEYLEHVQEALAFPPSGAGQDPKYLLYATEKQCEDLRFAHDAYCARVAEILGLQHAPMANFGLNQEFVTRVTSSDRTDSPNTIP